MVYIIVAAILILCTVLFLRYSAHVNAKKRMDNIRLAWGKPKSGSFYFDRISKFATLTKDKGFHQLSQQTLDDIDFYGLFSFIDRTSSKIGQQFLFKKVLQPENKIDDTLNTNADLFASNSGLREEIQKELSRLDTSDAYYISSLLQDKLLERPEWLSFLFINILIIIVLVTLSPIYPILLIFLIVPVSVNMLLHYWNKNNTYQFVRSFPQLSLLIDASDKISKRDILFRNKSVEESIATLKPFQWKMRLLSLEGGSIKDDLNQVVAYFIELLKVFLLVEVYTLFHLTKELETKKDSILTLFNYIGAIDTAISIASLRAGALKTCKPDLNQTSKKLSIKNVYHPLIEDCVKNDLCINGKSILITGSNMSGKSAFLRTIVINSILAQTIFTCFADEFKSPMLKQFSSIRIDDNLFERKSYYFEEVNIMASLIKEVECADQNLFILDEVFKGTNTIERIASAKAILSYLNRNNNIVIVATHDIELSGMLENEYDLYHFTDTIENDKLHFDHKIRAGQLKTRNAIKILEMSNYPEDIIQEAKTLSINLSAIKA